MWILTLVVEFWTANFVLEKYIIIFRIASLEGPNIPCDHTKQFLDLIPQYPMTELIHDDEATRIPWRLTLTWGFNRGDSWRRGRWFLWRLILPRCYDFTSLYLEITLVDHFLASDWRRCSCPAVGPVPHANCDCRHQTMLILISAHPLLSRSGTSLLLNPEAQSIAKIVRYGSKK